MLQLDDLSSDSDSDEFFDVVPLGHRVYDINSATNGSVAEKTNSKTAVQPVVPKTSTSGASVASPSGIVGSANSHKETVNGSTPIVSGKTVDSKSQKSVVTSTSQTNGTSLTSVAGVNSTTSLANNYQSGTSSSTVASADSTTSVPNSQPSGTSSSSVAGTNSASSVPADLTNGTSGSASKSSESVTSAASMAPPGTPVIMRTTQSGAGDRAVTPSPSLKKYQAPQPPGSLSRQASSASIARTSLASDKAIAPQPLSRQHSNASIARNSSAFSEDGKKCQRAPSFKKYPAPVPPGLVRENSSVSIVSSGGSLGPSKLNESFDSKMPGSVVTNNTPMTNGEVKTENTIKKKKTKAPVKTNGEVPVEPKQNKATNGHVEDILSAFQRGASDSRQQLKTAAKEKNAKKNSKGSNKDDQSKSSKSLSNGSSLDRTSRDVSFDSSVADDEKSKGSSKDSNSRKSSGKLGSLASKFETNSSSNDVKNTPGSPTEVKSRKFAPKPPKSKLGNLASKFEATEPVSPLKDEKSSVIGKLQSPYSKPFDYGQTQTPQVAPVSARSSIGGINVKKFGGTGKFPSQNQLRKNSKTDNEENESQCNEPADDSGSKEFVKESTPTVVKREASDANNVVSKTDEPQVNGSISASEKSNFSHKPEVNEVSETPKVADEVITPHKVVDIASSAPLSVAMSTAPSVDAKDIVKTSLTPTASTSLSVSKNSVATTSALASLSSSTATPSSKSTSVLSTVSTASTSEAPALSSAVGTIYSSSIAASPSTLSSVSSSAQISGASVPRTGPEPLPISSTKLAPISTPKSMSTTLEPKLSTPASLPSTSISLTETSTVLPSTSMLQSTTSVSPLLASVPLPITSVSPVSLPRTSVSLPTTSVSLPRTSALLGTSALATSSTSSTVSGKLILFPTSSAANNVVVTAPSVTTVVTSNVYDSSCRATSPSLLTGYKSSILDTGSSSEGLSRFRRSVSPSLASTYKSDALGARAADLRAASPEYSSPTLDLPPPLFPRASSVTPLGESVNLSPLPNASIFTRASSVSPSISVSRPGENGLNACLTDDIFNRARSLTPTESMGEKRTFRPKSKYLQGSSATSALELDKPESALEKYRRRKEMRNNAAKAKLDAVLKQSKDNSNSDSTLSTTSSGSKDGSTAPEASKFKLDLSSIKDFLRKTEEEISKLPRYIREPWTMSEFLGGGKSSHTSTTSAASTSTAAESISPSIDIQANISDSTRLSPLPSPTPDRSVVARRSSDGDAEVYVDAKELIDTSQLDTLMPLPDPHDLERRCRSVTPSRVIANTEKILSQTDRLLKKSRSGNSLRKSYSRSVCAANVDRVSVPRNAWETSYLFYTLPPCIVRFRAMSTIS